MPEITFDPTQNTDPNGSLNFDPTNPLEQTADRISKPYVPNFGDDFTPTENIPAANPITAPLAKEPTSFEDLKRQIDSQYQQKNPVFSKVDFLSPTLTPQEYTDKFTSMPAGFVKGVDMEDYYGKQESAFKTFGKGVLKLGASTVFKTGQGLGYVAGLLDPTNWDADVISNAADNGFAKIFEGLDKDLRDKWLPTYQEAEDRNKGFWARAFTDGDFWMDDVVDGLAFMASAWVPGIALSKLGLGMKAAQGLSKLRIGTSAAEAAVQGAGETANYLSKANSVFKTGIDKFNAWALATSSEAMYESVSVKDNIYKSLTKDPITGLTPINPLTNAPYTEAEKRKIAAAGAQNAFILNSALLSGTNAIELSWLGKMIGGVPTTGAMRGAVGAATLGEELTLAPGPKKFLGKFLETKKGAFTKGALQGIAVEGFLEENGQLAIERVNERYGAQGKIADTFNVKELVGQYLGQTGKAIVGKDPEAALSIGIGGILGLAGGVSGVKDYNADKAYTQASINAFNNTQQSWLKFGNPYKMEEVVTKDENGNEIRTQVLSRDAENNLILDAEKLSGIVSSYTSVTAALDEADKTTDLFKRDLLRNTAFADFVKAHVDAGIEDTIFDKLDAVRKATPEDIAKLGFSLDKNVDTQINKYKALASNIINQNKLLNSDIIFDSSVEDTARKSYMTNIAAQQAVFKSMLNDVYNESETLKGQILTSQNTSLSDGLVDQLNELEYRIKSQKEVIAAFEKMGGKIEALSIAKQVLEELEEDKTELLKDNVDTAKNLKKGEDGLYKYEKKQRNEPGISDQYVKKVKLKGELQNHNRSLGLEWAKYADTINGKDNFMKALKGDIVKAAEDEQEKQKEAEVKEKQPKEKAAPSNKIKVEFTTEEGDTDFFEFENGKTYIVRKEDGTADYYNNIQVSPDGKTVSYNLNFEGQVETDAEELAQFAKENGWEIFVRGGKKGPVIAPKTEHPKELESGNYIEEDPETPTYSYSDKRPKFELVGFNKTFGRHYKDKGDTQINDEFGSDRFFAFTSKFDFSGGDYVLKVVTSSNDDFDIRQEDKNIDDIKVIVLKKTVGRDKKATYNYVDVDGNIIQDEDANKDNIIYRSLSNINNETPDSIRNKEKGKYDVDDSMSDDEIQAQIDLHSKWQEDLVKRTKRGDVYLDIIGSSPGIQRVEYTTAIGKNGQPEIAKASLEGRVIVEDPDWTDLRSANNPDNHIRLRVNTADGALAKGLLAGRAIMQEYYYDVDGKVRYTDKTTRVFNRLLTDSEKETVVNALARFSELVGRPKNNPLSLEEKNEFTLLLDYLKGVLNWGAPKEGVSPDKFIWIESGLHIGDAVYKFDRETIMKNKVSILNGVYHHINSSMLNKNESFQDIEFKKNKAVPKGKLYTTYEEYLLASRENAEVPPVYTSLPKIDSDKPQRTNVFLMWRDPAQAEMKPIGSIERTYKTPKKDKKKGSTKRKGTTAIDNVIDKFLNYKIKKINIFGIDVSHVKTKAGYQIKFYNPKRNQTFTSDPYRSVRELIAGKYGLKALISKVTNYQPAAKEFKKTSKKGGVRGDIALADTIESIISGDVTTTIRTESYHKKFYKGDGVYKTENGDLVDIEYLGTIKLKGDRIKGKNVNISTDEFAQGEGFESWEDLSKDKWAAKTLAEGEKEIHYYNVSAVDTEGTEDEEENVPASKPKGKASLWDEIEANTKSNTFQKTTQQKTTPTKPAGKTIVTWDDIDASAKTGNFQKTGAQASTASKKQPEVKIEIPEGIFTTMDEAIANSKKSGNKLTGVLYTSYNPATEEGNKIQATVDIINNDLIAAKTKLKIALQRQIPAEDEEAPFRMPIEEMVEKEDFKKLSSFMSQKLPQFPVTRMANMIHGKAWGMFHNGGIYIYENAGYGTGFHEAFEAVWAAYITDAERETLAKEFRSREGKFTNPFSKETKTYSEASMYDVREMLAEEFADYIKNEYEEPKEAKGIVKFFKDLWNAIKELFGLNKADKTELYSNINDVFKAIGKGKFKNLTPIRELNKLAPAYKQVGNISQSDTAEILQGLNYHFFSDLYINGNNINSILGGLSKTESNALLSSIFENSYNKVKQGLSLYPTIQVEMDVNKEDLYNLFRSNLERYGAQFKEIEQDEEDVTDTLGIRDSVTIDPRKSTSASVRLLLASIPEVKYNKEGKRVLVKSDALKLPKLVNGDKLHLTLLNELSNIVPIVDKNGERVNVINQMFEKLDKKYKNIDDTYKKDYGWIQSLKTRLKYENADGTLVDASTLSKDDIQLRVAFIKSFTNVKLAPEKTIIGEDGYVYNFNPLNELASERIRTEWSNNVKSQIQSRKTGIVTLDPSGIMVINRESKDYVDLMDALRNKNNLDIYDILDTYKKLGIEFSASVEDINKYRSDLRTNLIQILELIRNGEINSINELYGNQTIGGRMNDLVSLEERFSSEDNVLSYLNANGESEYAVGNTSLFSNIVNTLNTVSSLEELVQSCPWLGKIETAPGLGTYVRLNAYQADSDILKPGGLLFDAKGKRKPGRVTYHNISGMGLTNEEGSTTAQLLFPERVANKIHYLMNNVAFTNINSDKNREYGIGLPGKMLVTPDEANRFIEEGSSKIILDKYLSQLSAEMAAAVQQKENPVYIQYYQKGVYNLGHFKNILSEKTIAKFKEEVLGKKPKYKATKSKPDAYKDFLNDNAGLINKEITTYLNKEISKTSEWLKDLDIFQKAPVKGEDVYITNAIDNVTLADLLKINFDIDKKASTTNQVVVYKDEDTGEKITRLALTEDDINNLSAVLLMNEELLLAEQHKLIYGHPAMYKDLAKRANGATSTKEAFVEDSDVISWMDKNMVRNDGKVRSEEVHQTTKVITFKDQDVVSIFYKDIAEGIYADLLESGLSKEDAQIKTGALFNDANEIVGYIKDGEKYTGAVGAYMNLNEADAMAWGMPDTVRDMLFGTSKMTPEQEAQWDYEIAYEKIARSKKDKSDPAYKKYNKTELDKAQEIVDKGDQGYVWQVLKPQYFGYAENEDITHPVFLKHAVQPKFYRHVEGTQYEKLYLAAQNNQVDIIGFVSGQKVGSVTDESGEFTPIYDEKGIVNVVDGKKKGYQLPESLAQLKVYSKFYGIQVEVSSKAKNSVVRGTQVTKLIMVNFFNNGEPINPDLGALIKEYNDTLREMIRLGKVQLLKELGLTKTEDGYETTNLSRLINILRKEAKNRDLPDNMIDAINALQNEDGTEELEFPFDTLINREKIDNILNSIVDSRVISEKMHGKSSVQVASTLYESNPRGFMYLKDGVYKTLTAKEVKGLTDEERASVRMTSSDLKFYRNEKGRVTAMEAYITWPFKEVSPEDLGLKLENGIYKMPENGVPGLPKELLKAIGFRIPTQAPNSIENIIIKGFTPAANGDMIVVPSEIVGKAGSDFDIDKLNLYLPNYSVDGPNYNKPEFKQFMVNQITLRGIPSSVAERLFDGFSIEDFKKINKAAPNDTIKGLKNLTTSLSDITGNEDEFLEADIIKKALVAYNKQFKGPKKLIYTEPGTDSKAALQNKFMEVTRKLMERPENYAQLVTPNSTATLKGLATDINKAKVAAGTKMMEDESSATFLRSFVGSSQTRERYLTAKRMVGIAALHSTFHSLAQVAGLKVNPYFKTDNTHYLEVKDKGVAPKWDKIDVKLDHHPTVKSTSTYEGEEYTTDVYNIGHRTDVVGQMISDLFSEAVSGFVDGAKDPFVFDLNFSMNSAGTWFYLTHLGVPTEQIAYFFNQPIMDQYFKEQSKNKSNFKVINNEDLFNEDLFYKVIAPYYKKVFKEDILKQIALLENLTNPFVLIDYKKRIAININKANDSFKKFESSKLKKNIDEGAAADPKMQIAILMNYLKYQSQSRMLSNFMQGISYDNKKTKTIQENQLQVSKWERAKTERFIHNPDAVLDSTFLGELKEQKEDVFNMFKKFFITLTPELQKAFEPLYAKLDNPDYIAKKDDMINLLDRYQNFVLSYVLHTTPYMNAEGKEETLNQLYKDMFVGKTSIAKSLYQYKYKTDDPTISDNLIVKELIPLFTDDASSTNNIKLFKSKMDTFQINNVIEALDNLKSYATSTGDLELSNFVDNLAKFSIIQSGMQSTSVDYKKILSKNIYSTFVKAILENYAKNPEVDVNNIWVNFHQNNWNNKNVVPKAPSWIKVKNGEFRVKSTSKMAVHDFVTKSIRKKYVDGKPVTFSLLKKLAKEKRLFDAFDTALFYNTGEMDSKGKVLYQMIDKRGNGSKFTEIYTDDTESILPKNKMMKVDPLSRSQSSDGFSKPNWDRLKKKKAEELGEIPQDDSEEVFGEVKVKKIISGGQTGADRTGLEIGKELNIETGGTATPGFATEKGKDLTLKDFGLEEISKELQAGKSGREFYLPRTEQNVLNSDGTVYFATDEDSAGKIATEKFAKKHNKPFILNPTAQQLRNWLITNEIEVLNVAGNRGSKLSKANVEKIKSVLREALSETQDYTTEFDNLEEFDDERKQEILTNFATKHKLSEEDAKTAINVALEIDRQQTIDKLKECY